MLYNENYRPVGIRIESWHWQLQQKIVRISGVGRIIEKKWQERN
jgi:hypothetical protein